MPLAPRTLKNYSLEEFCNRCLQFVNAKDFGSLVHFVLTGVLDNEQAVIDVHQNAIQREDLRHLTAMRDYDSVIGISDGIMVLKFLTIQILPNFKESLSKNVHIKYRFTNIHGDFNVPVHTIPNICIGKWMDRHCVRILFLDLYSEDRKTHYVSKEECAEFYEKGLRPALQDVLPARDGVLPATLDLELFRAQNAAGHIAYSGRIIPDDAVSSLHTQILEHLSYNDVAWGTNIAFLHEIRGVKDAHLHTPDDGTSEIEFWDLITKNFINPAVMEDPNWYVDVAVEIKSNHKECLAWRTDAHNLIVHHLGGLNQNQASRITRPGSSQYYRDITSHLTGVSGFRIAPGRNGRGIYNLHYMQAYTTDKALTYRLDGTHAGKYLTVKQILLKKANKYLEQLYQLYMESVWDNYSSARVELRVPIARSSEPLNWIFNGGYISRYLVAFPRSAWWCFRAYSALAYKLVLEWQFSGSLNSMAERPAMLLTAAAPWFLNSLHSAPDTGPSSRELMDAILPHVPIEEADPEHLPYRIPLPHHGDDGIEQHDGDSIEQNVDQYDGEEDAAGPSQSEMWRERGHDADEEEEVDAMIANLTLDGDYSQGPSLSRRRSHLDMYAARQEEEEESDVEELGPLNPMDVDGESSDEEERALMEQRRRRAVTTVPVIPYGAIFLRPIRLGGVHPVPRFRVGPWISVKAVQYLFGMDMDSVVAIFNSPTVSIPRNQQRIRNKVTHKVVLETIPRVFDLESRGHTLQLPPRDEGSDIEHWDTDDDEDEDIPSGLDKNLDRILARFWIDVLLVSPNRRSATEPPYLVDALDEHARKNATQAIYQNENLAETFNDCFWKKVGTKQWRMNFDALWPNRERIVKGQVQNYPNMEYYKKWNIFTASNDEETIKDAKDLLWGIFKDLYWLPHAHSDRVWDTRARGAENKYKKSSGIAIDKPAPRILVYKKEPKWEPRDMPIF